MTPEGIEFGGGERPHAAIWRPRWSPEKPWPGGIFFDAMAAPDGPRPGAHGRVGFDREGSDLAGAVAGLTLLLKYWLGVFVERHPGQAFGGVSIRQKSAAEQDCEVERRAHA